MSDDPPLFARLSASFVNGRWQTPDGKALTFAPGTKAVFEVAQHDLPTMGWEEALSVQMPPRVFLPVGTKLRFAVSLGPPDQISKACLAHLIRPDDMAGQVVWDSKAWATRDSHFFEVTLGPVVTGIGSPYDEPEGGLYVATDGGGSVRISTGPLRFPDGVVPHEPRSLNHMLTLLSEVYEVHRAHHTGSIFQRVFYQEYNGQWRSLEFLRSRWAGFEDDSRARDFWTKGGW